MISLIAAMTNDRVIGKNGRMPWGRIEAELNYFKEKTVGHTVIMGRKTYESIGRPLPMRENIVVTHNQYTRQSAREGVYYVDMDKAIRIANAESRHGGEVFIIGGETLYRQFFPIADRVYQTIITGQEFEGDTFFPDPNIYGKWDSTFLDADYEGDLRMAYYLLERLPEPIPKDLFTFTW